MARNDHLVYKENEVPALMKILEPLYDVVRLVDPFENVVYTVHNGEIARGAEPTGKKHGHCYSVWSREAPCLNCISKAACTQLKHKSKIEFIKDEVYLVNSIPVTVDRNGVHTVVALELVTKIDDGMCIGSSRTSTSTAISIVERVRKEIYQDSLTGCYNRRYYDDNQFLSSFEHKIPLAVGFMYCDIHHFKNINDGFGHTVGDWVLKAVAGVMKKSVRTTDAVIRLGGDEFLVVCFNCPEEALHVKAEKIKEGVSQIRLAEDDTYRLNVDIGCAGKADFCGTVAEVVTLLQQADAGMYVQKRSED